MITQAEKDEAIASLNAKPIDIIPRGHGTFREVRPGLGVQLLRYDVDCTVEPHVWTGKIVVSSWNAKGASA